MRVRDCGGYYVYRFDAPATCMLRFCGESTPVAEGDVRLAGDACYQRVLSVLGQGKEAALRERAAGIIEASARGPRPPELAVTWRNTWNVIDDARQSLRPEEADRLVTRLAPFIDRKSTRLNSSH